MSAYKIAFTSKASIDVEKAIHWYNLQQDDLGELFGKRLIEAVNDILKHPLGYSIKHNNTREKLIKKFPYVIVFEIEQKSIIVYRVFHCKQNPTKKLSKK